MNQPGRLCAGNGCVDNEVFPDSIYDGVIKLSANNNVIEFNDNSTNGFPDRDWRIQANETSGGSSGEAFFVQDLTAGTNPLYIEGDAPSNALFIASGGGIGFGTSLPQEDLHIIATISPQIRLEEQDSAPYIWDIGANDVSFFIEDETTGSLPFVIDAGAPDNAFQMISNGNIGFGTSFPATSLHIQRTDGTAKILVQEGSGAQEVRELFRMQNNGGSYFTLANTQSSRDWFFTHENAAAGRFIITSSTNPSQGLFLDPDGDLRIGGTLTENSDKHAKMAVVPVDAAEILDKVAQLPVSSWTYKDDTLGARHVGPMAQDFYAAFGLGTTETGIATLDTSGVALASIKALHDENQALKAQLAGLAAEKDAMRMQHDSKLAVLDAQHAKQFAILTTRLEALEAQ